MTQEGVTSAIISWSYGEGNEGVFVPPTSSSDKVLIVGRGIPWWGMVVASVNLRIHSILLSDTHFTSIVSAYFGTRIPIAKAVEQTRPDVLATRRALSECKVVAVESLPNSSATLSEMWE
jgi:hypothetical protein